MATSSDEERSSRRSREKRKHRSRDKRRKRSSEKSADRRRDKSEEKRRKLDKHDNSRSRHSSSRHCDRRRNETRSRDSNPTPEPVPEVETETAEDRARRRKEEEQALLDEEMEKRRERVRKWQQKRREALEKTEQELDAREKANENKKKWSLEDDEDDDDMIPPPINSNGEAMELESDPLEAFMAQEILPKMQVDVKKALFLEEKEEQNAIKDIQTEDTRSVHVPNSKLEKKKEFDPYDSETSDLWYNEEEEDEDDEEWFRRLQAGRLSKGDRLAPVDHTSLIYETFRKCLYIEVREITKMTDQEVKAYRKEIDSIKVRGKEIPKPIKTWSQSGLSERMVEVMKKSGFLTPLPIQAQALPVIMSGRDCIGIAKTGSGKTLAFVLPMLRHIKDQRPVSSSEGPIGLIMAPTRELVQQIGKEIKQFAKFLEVSCVCVYGGSGVANQINELKRGAEIVVCTPGRMIDLLVTSNGKITNLRRVTFLVLDEADRMFDMGFEPQITRIVSNIRPDRQTVMFSATFPRQVELLARKLLNDPIEILVGGRSVVNADITQFVEIRPSEDRLLRTLEILGQWHDKGKVRPISKLLILICGDPRYWYL